MNTKHISIYTKIIILVMSVSLILGLSTVVLIKGFISGRMAAELERRGVCAGRNLVSGSIEPILVDDLVKLQKMIFNIKQLEKDVNYIFILNNQNIPIVHTFGNYFPKGLVKANPILNSQTKSIQVLNTEQGIIRDIALPILDGKLGSVHLGISENRLKEALSVLMKGLTITMVIVLIIGILVTYLVTRKILRPLMEVSKAIKKIGEGKYNQNIPVKSNDEIGHLANTFNKMAEKLERANTELRSTQNRLVQSAKMATIGQFSAGIAHEINNPLAGILNCIRSLLGDPGITGQKRGYLELALKGLIRIESTIIQVLHSSGKIVFKPELININQQIESALDFVRHKLEERNIAIKKNMDTSLPETMGDPNQLQQVFLNIMNNAIDALLPGGRIEISTTCFGKNIEIVFNDNGMGIKQENIDRILEPFYTTKEVGKGVGLGLSISYNIIQQHKGSFDINSKDGEGTSVIITLPLIEGIIETNNKNVRIINV